jgi:alpha-tubulin suppressor-like RCC1 family protein
MKRASFIASICTLALSACSAPNATTGTLELSLKGAGSLGGNYQLTAASFTVTGPQNLTISGDPDTILQSLPVGVYNVKLENGWKLQKTVGNTSTDVVASVASANPQPVVVNAGTTSSVTWLFNVSGSNADADDLEIVAVSNGALSIALAAGEAAWSNFSTGALHSCGITATGQLRCFGDNGNGQLGYGDNVSRLSPAGNINVGVGRTVKRVVASHNSSPHTCALLDDATVKCWGYNNWGQLGYADGSQRNAPSDATVNLGSSNTAKTIAVGDYHTCVILDNNLVKCWGNNGSGQLGYNDTSSRTAPAAAAIDLGSGNAAKSIVAGSAHTCALLANNSVRCWGNNNNGQLGYGDTAQRWSPIGGPVNLGTGRSAKRLVAGASHTCAILDNDTVKCWGNNGNGQLGYGDTNPRLSPPDTAVNLGQGRTAKLIAAGNAHTCAQLDDDSIKCWGANANGELGYEDTNQRSAPPALGVALGTGRVPRRLQANGAHTCVLLTDNGMKCWGYNDYGQFGLGVSGDRRGDQTSEMGDNMPESLP